MNKLILLFTLTHKFSIYKLLKSTMFEFYSKKELLLKYKIYIPHENYREN